MSKRSFEEQDSESAPPKRAKKKRTSKFGNDAVKFRHVEQIQTELDFFPDDLQRQRQGIKALTSLLEATLSGDETLESEALSLILQFVKSKDFSADVDDHTVCLPGLMQAWKHSSFGNEESLLTDIPAVLALLLRILSSNIDLRSVGISLCRTLLHPHRTRLIARGLSSAPSKERLIGPCLRLVLEIVTFDGGSLTRLVFNSREALLRSLPRNLSLSKPLTDDDELDRRKPSIRTHSARVFLAMVKLSSDMIKMRLFEMYDIIKALFKDFEHDPTELLVSLVSCIREQLVLHRHTISEFKRQFFSTWVLQRLYSLVTSDGEDSSNPSPRTEIREHVQQLFLSICCSTGPGILPSAIENLLTISKDSKPQTRVERINLLLSESIGEAKLRSAFLTDKGTNQAKSNMALIAFSVGLQPWSELEHSELILGMFKANWWYCSLYFSHLKGFSLVTEDENDEDWMKRSAFILAIIRLTPPDLSKHAFEAVDISHICNALIETILPRPATKKVLSGFLVGKSSICRFFAVQLLCIALQKLNAICKTFSSRPDPSVEDQITSRLRLLFIQRSPSFSNAIYAFRAMVNNDFRQRESAARLLSLYCTTVPSICLREKFDVSGILEDRLKLYHLETSERGGRPSFSGELECLLTVARSLTTTKWWQKSGKVEVSCLTSLLRMMSSNPDLDLARSGESTLLQLASDLHLFSEPQVEKGIRLLVITGSKAFRQVESDEIFQLIDRTLSHYIVQPVRYLDSWEGLTGDTEQDVDEADDSGDMPIVMSVLEQWQYLTKSTSSRQVQISIALWINTFLLDSAALGFAQSMTAMLQVQFSLASEDEEVKGIFRSSSMIDSILEDQHRLPAHEDHREASGRATNEERTSGNQISAENSSHLDPDSEEEPVNERSALIRWSDFELEQVVEEGHVGRLVACLVSSSLAIREHAFANISTFAKKLEQSKYTERSSIALLLKELLYSVESLPKEQAFPTFLVAFTTEALKVLSDPSHSLYPKVNDFLQSGPLWSQRKIPMVQKILMTSPTEDKAYFLEHEWLMRMLLKGLRTKEDLNVYRRCNIFERVLPLAHLSQNLQKLVLSLLARSTKIEDGSVTLMTRCAILTWTRAMMVTRGAETDSLETLMRSLQMESSNDRVVKWVGGDSAYMAGSCRGGRGEMQEMREMHDEHFATSVGR